MAELDVFERRLRSALVCHVADGPTDFDALEFARTVAAKEPRRHGLGAILGWRGVAVPRVAWVFLLLAAVLTALVGGMLVVGSRPSAIGFVCPAGSTPDQPGPVDQVRPGMPETTAFDRRAGKLVALTKAADRFATWTFDVCTNTWAPMYPDREPPSIEFWPLVYDVDSDATILVAGGRVWAYDLHADTWTEKGAAPAGATPWAYDPLSGLVVAGNYDTPEDLWHYDVETDTWTPIRQMNLPDGVDPPYVAYDASVDRFIGYGGGMALFDVRTGTWSSSRAETPTISAGYGWSAPKVAYDEAAERTVVFGNDRQALYDASTDSWEIVLAAENGGHAPDSMVYDPVNERLVGCVSLEAWPMTEARIAVIAFDLTTREWTVLFEAP